MSLIRYLSKQRSISEPLVAYQSITVGLRAAALFAVVASAVSLMPTKTIAGDCGDGNDNGNADSYACGDNAVTIGNWSTAVGVDTRAAGPEGTAVGYTSETGNGNGNTALGAYSQAGTSPLLGNSGATAIGMGAQAGSGGDNRPDATALGIMSEANAANATAVGGRTKANYNGSMALGHGAETSLDDQVAIGTADNSYTLAGINSNISKGRQGGQTYMVTSDAAGNLATSTFDIASLEGLPARMTAVEAKNTDQDNRLHNVEQKNIDQDETLEDHEGRIGSLEFEVFDPAGSVAQLDRRVTTNTQNIAALDNRVTTLENGFQDLGNRIASNQKEARGGTALALAAASLRYDDRPEKLSIAGGVGHFKGLTGMSFGVGYATSESLRFNAAISGVPENGDVGFSAGASWTLN